MGSWPVGLRWLEWPPYTGRSHVRFPIRAKAWVVGLSSVGRRTGVKQLVFLSLMFLSLLSPLYYKKKKENVSDYPYNHTNID